MIMESSPETVDIMALNDKQNLPISYIHILSNHHGNTLSKQMPYDGVTFVIHFLCNPLCRKWFRLALFGALAQKEEAPISVSRFIKILVASQRNYRINRLNDNEIWTFGVWNFMHFFSALSPNLQIFLLPQRGLRIRFSAFALFFSSSSDFFCLSKACLLSMSRCAGVSTSVPTILPVNTAGVWWQNTRCSALRVGNMTRCDPTSKGGGGGGSSNGNHPQPAVTIGNRQSPLVTNPLPGTGRATPANEHGVPVSPVTLTASLIICRLPSFNPHPPTSRLIS